MGKNHASQYANFGSLPLFDISVLDHIIVGEDGYFSYVDEGRL